MAKVKVSYKQILYYTTEFEYDTNDPNWEDTLVQDIYDDILSLPLSDPISEIVEVEEVSKS